MLATQTRGEAIDLFLMSTHERSLAITAFDSQSTASSIPIVKTTLADEPSRLLQQLCCTKSDDDKLTHHAMQNSLSANELTLGGCDCSRFGRWRNVHRFGFHISYIDEVSASTLTGHESTIHCVRLSGKPRHLQWFINIDL